MKDLRGKHAIITGCSRGIGMEVAKLLATAGVHLAMHARDGDRLHKAAESVRALGVQAITVAGDITNRTVRSELVARSLQAFGSIDLLINTVGIEPMARFATQSEDEMVTTIEVNLTAPHAPCCNAWCGSGEMRPST
jgi:3-oxoacyl-[acyl-carrier protein] reductase